MNKSVLFKLYRAGKINHNKQFCSNFLMAQVDFKDVAIGIICVVHNNQLVSLYLSLGLPKATDVFNGKTGHSSQPSLF